LLKACCSSSIACCLALLCHPAVNVDWRKFVVKLLGPEGVRGSAPWPWDAELKPFEEMRYIARE
jgi:hypothetical protein